MSYYYSTVNGITMNHSEVLLKDGFEKVNVHFERPGKNGFDFLDIELPGNIVFKSFGFSEDDIMDMQEYVRDNDSLIWEFARNGGGMNA